MLVTTVWQAVRLLLWKSAHQILLSVFVLCFFLQISWWFFSGLCGCLYAFAVYFHPFADLFFSIKLQNDMDMIFQWVSWLNANQSPSSFVHSQNAHILFLVLLTCIFLCYCCAALCKSFLRMHKSYFWFFWHSSFNAMMLQWEISSSLWHMV